MLRPQQTIDSATAFARSVQAIMIFDLKRAWPERIRLVVGLIQPLLYLFVLGGGLASIISAGEQYTVFLFPGVLALNLISLSMFSAVTMVFDRQMGILKAILVTPTPLWTIVIGKTCAGALLAILQTILLLPAAIALGIPFGAIQGIVLVAAMCFVAVIFSAIGVAIAVHFESTTVFPVVGSAVVLPMFFTSGALYPTASAPAWLQMIATFNPAAYAVQVLRGVFDGSAQSFLSAYLPALSSLVAIGAAACCMAVRTLERAEDGGRSPSTFRMA